MPGTPFSSVPATPEGHFRLQFYAALLFVIDRLGQMFETQKMGFERFPFLVGYVNELAQMGIEGMTTADALQWWRAQQRQWESSASTFLPIRALQQAAGLSDDALNIYFVLGLSEEDARFGALFETLHGLPGQHYVTYGLLNTWGTGLDSHVRTIVQQLQAAGIVHVSNAQAPRAEWALCPEALVWDCLSGRGLSTAVRWFEHRPATALLTLDQLIIDDALYAQQRQLPALLAAGDITTIVVRGPQHNGRKTLLGALAAALDCGVLEIQGVSTAGDERWHTVGPLATALHAMPVVTYELAPGETALLPQLSAYTGPIGVAMGRAGGVYNAAQVLTLTIIPPSFEQRGLHWQRALDGIEVEAQEEVSRQLRVTSGAIYRAATLARSYARLAGRTALSIADVRQATAALCRQALDTLAEPLAPVGDWNELVACDETLQELMTLESRCRHRETLPASVSPALAGQMTTGVRALFTGPSGTGKTLAARILASVLNMDLYRLDLSSVVNKYIGETEKNLNALFSRAEELDIILLIDEGDALLTQRTNVQSSNDRYANLETNFLLQRLESFTGVVLITTNAGDRIDSAFQRRMDVVVEFHTPEAAERWGIWQLHLPAGHCVDGALLREVSSRCTLTGGQIRNTVLHASVLALEDGGTVTSGHLRDAVQREYRKMGAVCPLRRADMFALRQGL